MTTPAGQRDEPVGPSHEPVGPASRSSRLQGKPVQRRAAGSGRLRGRFKRTPLLIAVLVVAVVSGVVLFAVGARPNAVLIESIAVEQAYVGTPYAFDGLVCLSSQVTGATVSGVEVEQAAGSTTRVLRAPAGPPTLGFPVPNAGGEPLQGLEVPPGDSDCDVRLLVTPTEQGPVTAGTVSIRLSYGPLGLLRRTATLQPRVNLDVAGTGRDPRTSG